MTKKEKTILLVQTLNMQQEEIKNLYNKHNIPLPNITIKLPKGTLTLCEPIFLLKEAKLEGGLECQKS